MSKENAARPATTPRTKSRSLPFRNLEGRDDVEDLTEQGKGISWVAAWGLRGRTDWSSFVHPRALWEEASGSISDEAGGGRTSERGLPRQRSQRGGETPSFCELEWCGRRRPVQADCQRSGILALDLSRPCVRVLSSPLLLLAVEQTLPPSPSA